MNKEYLSAFKDLQITKKELCNKLGVDNLHESPIDEIIVVYASDVIALLKAYASKKITLEWLLDWVNVVWFTDLFVYAEKENDAIASVMNYLEELDEENRELTNSTIEGYISALENNRELEKLTCPKHHTLDFND